MDNKLSDRARCIAFGKDRGATMTQLTVETDQHGVFDLVIGRFPSIGNATLILYVGRPGVDCDHSDSLPGDICEELYDEARRLAAYEEAICA